MVHFALCLLDFSLVMENFCFLSIESLASLSLVSLQKKFHFQKMMEFLEVNSTTLTGSSDSCWCCFYSGAEMFLHWVCRNREIPWPHGDQCENPPMENFPGALGAPGGPMSSWSDKNASEKCVIPKFWLKKCVTPKFKPRKFEKPCLALSQLQVQYNMWI